MVEAVIIVTALRIIAPLLMLKNPFWGMVLAVLAVGVVLFEITRQRYLLIISPNLFEFFFLFYATLKPIDPISESEQASAWRLS